MQQTWHLRHSPLPWSQGLIPPPFQWDLRGTLLILAQTWSRENMLLSQALKLSIAIYRAMSRLLTLQIPFYTNSWQQWLGLAFFYDCVFTALWKLPTVRNKVLRLCSYTYYRGLLLPTLLCRMPSGTFTPSQAEEASLIDKHEADRISLLHQGSWRAEGSATGQRIQEETTSRLWHCFRWIPVPDFQRWAEDMYIYPWLASHCHI